MFLWMKIRSQDRMAGRSLPSSSVRPPHSPLVSVCVISPVAHSFILVPLACVDALYLLPADKVDPWLAGLCLQTKPAALDASPGHGFKFEPMLYERASQLRTASFDRKLQILIDRGRLWTAKEAEIREIRHKAPSGLPRICDQTYSDLSSILCGRSPEELINLSKQLSG